MRKKDVLITDYVHPVLLEGLRTLGYSTTYAPEMSREEMSDVLCFYQGVVINTRCAIDRQVIETAPSLLWVARLGSGLDIIDLEAAGERNVSVLSAPEGNAQAVAEHAMAMLLALSNKIPSADQSVRNGDWLREEHRGWEIAGKTIGIIGYGNNGSAFGRLWKGWDVRVMAYDKYLEQYAPTHVMETDLDTLLEQCDIISLHIPLTLETRELVNFAFIEKCKRGFVLINTSRGKNMDLEAVTDALERGQMGGGCFDVFPFEPPATGSEEFKISFAKLCGMSNVVLSPHVAGWSVESRRKISEVLLEKIGGIVASK